MQKAVNDLNEFFGKKCLVTDQEQPGGLAEATERFRRKFVIDTLRRTRGNRSTAARFLKVHRNTVNRLVLEYGLPKKWKDWAEQS